jgi:hypothetical protein
MDIKTATDVQLLVEDMGWKQLSPVEIVDKLDTLAQQELKAARLQVNRRVWDETYDDEMAATARWAYTRKHATFTEAIEIWYAEANK